jgi:hypothetical protein
MTQLGPFKVNIGLKSKSMKHLNQKLSTSTLSFTPVSNWELHNH